MSDQIDFFLGVCRPEIDGEDEIRGIDVAVREKRFSIVRA